MTRASLWVLAMGLAIATAACGDDSASGGSGAGGGGGDDAGGGDEGGGEPQPGDPCRDGSACGGQELLCFLPGQCNQGAGPCAGPTHCLAGEYAEFETCVPQACELAAPDCPEGSTCADADCGGTPCTVCLPDVEVCASDADCPAGHACIDSECRTGCREDGDCSSSQEICDVAHECVPAPCASDDDCSGGGFCLAGGCFESLGTCDYPAP